MNENNETTIGVSKETRDRLKMLSIISGKKLYELVAESVLLLEDKYNDE